MIEKYKKSLVAPLDEKELHIFNSDETLQDIVTTILHIMRNKVYGIYLAGGMRGCGKTSLMNLCCRLNRFPEQIRIRIDCNKLVDTDNFLYFFILSLSEETDGKELRGDIKSKIENLKDVISNHKVKRQYRESKRSKKRTETDHFAVQSKASISLKLFEKLLSVVREASSQQSIANTSGREETCHQVEEEQETYERYKLLELLSDILIQMSDQYEVLVVVDELDKKDINFIRDLIDAYKNLFLNSHVIIFLLVDLLTYMELTSGNELDNQLLSYINRAIYIPSNNFESLKKYLYRELDVDNMHAALIINYLSLGLFRKMNLHQYLEGTEGQYLFLKAYLYQELVSNYKKGRSGKQELDLYKVYAKEMTEKLFADRVITEKEAFTCQDGRTYFRPFQFAREYLTGLNRFSCVQSFVNRNMAKGEAYELNLSGFSIYELEQEYREQEIVPAVSASDCRDINKAIPVNRRYEYIQISERDEYSFRYMIRFINTLIKDIDNLLIIRKIRNFNGEEYAYSLLLDVGKKIGRILYCIEDFSFSYECRQGIESVKNFIKNHDIPIIEIETDDEPVEKSLDYIIEKAKKLINGE